MSGVILPTITHVGAQPIYGSGGGGGGGSNYPADAVFSTITLNDSGTQQPNILVGTASDNFQMTIAAGSGVVIEDSDLTNNARIDLNGYDGSILSLDTNERVVLQIQPDGNGYCSIAPGSAGINAGLGIDIQVSTINGAPYVPGGGSYNPNPQFSTITMPDNGILSMSQKFVIQDPVPGNATFTFDTAESANSIVTSFTAPGNAQILSIGAQGGFSLNSFLNLAQTEQGGSVIAAVNDNGNPSTLTIAADNMIVQSNMTVSSINGAQYPPSFTSNMFIPYETTSPVATLVLGSPINYSTVVSSLVYSAKQMIQISGNLTSQVEFAGSGNTNPPKNVAQTGDANFGIELIIDGSNVLPLTSLSFTNPNNTGLPATFNSSNASYTFNSQYGSFQLNPSYGFGSAGTEFCYTNLGAHTYQLRAWTDIYIATADPGTNYNMFLNIPTWAKDGSNNAGLFVQSI